MSFLLMLVLLQPAANWATKTQQIDDRLDYLTQRISADEAIAAAVTEQAQEIKASNQDNKDQIQRLNDRADDLLGVLKWIGSLVTSLSGGSFLLSWGNRNKLVLAASQLNGIKKDS